MTSLRQKLQLPEHRIPYLPEQNYQLAFIQMPLSSMLGECGVDVVTLG